MVVPPPGLVGKITPEAQVAKYAVQRKLPPLPRPLYLTQCAESLISLLTILLAIGGYMLAIFLLVSVDGFGQAGRHVCIGITIAESAAALCFYVMLMLGDPGIIRRSPENSYPLPQIVEERLDAKSPLPLRNISGADGRSFCIRCFVWRSEGTAKEATGKWQRRLSSIVENAPSCGIIADGVYAGGHHCSVCQRCVRDFDHHCSFYGRCITKHNMVYFKAIINLGYLAIGTCIMLIPVSVAHLSGFWATIVASAILLVLCLWSMRYCGACLLLIILKPFRAIIHMNSDG